MKAKQLYLFDPVKTQIDTSGKVFVNGYRRNNGTYVKPYWRKNPGRQLGVRRHLAAKKEQLPLFK